MIPIEVSARHVHVSAEDLSVLFGADHALTFVRDLSQPGQFVCQERVDLVGPKNTIKNVVVLGPERKKTQAEASMTDCFTLGVTAPVRESGDLEGSAPILIKGPRGEVTGNLIIAKRHIHMTPEDAAELGVRDKQIVCVKTNTSRCVAFGDTVVRVSDAFRLAMHIDTDEANAAAVDRAGGSGEIVTGM